MPTSTVRIKPETREHLKQIADDEGLSLTEALAQVVEAARRQRIVDQANAGWAALKADPEAWANYRREVALFEGAIADGLPTEPNGDR